MRVSCLIFVESKHKGMLEVLRVKGRKALSIMFIWNYSLETTWRIHKTSNLACLRSWPTRPASAPFLAEILADFSLSFENKSIAFYICSMFSSNPRETSLTHTKQGRKLLKKPLRLTQMSCTKSQGLNWNAADLVCSTFIIFLPHIDLNHKKKKLTWQFENTKVWWAERNQWSDNFLWT